MHRRTAFTLIFFLRRKNPAGEGGAKLNNQRYENSATSARFRSAPVALFLFEVHQIGDGAGDQVRLERAARSLLAPVPQQHELGANRAIEFTLGECSRKNPE